MCMKQYTFAVFSRNMMDLCEAAAHTLCYPPCDISSMLQIEEIINTLSLKSQPSLSISHWSGVQLLKGTEQEKEKWVQLL